MDEIVENAVKVPDEVSQLENTYIFYTTDDGYHIGQHRMHPGKECDFETDVHIPLSYNAPSHAAGNNIYKVMASLERATTCTIRCGALTKPNFMT